MDNIIGTIYGNTDFTIIRKFVLELAHFLLEMFKRVDLRRLNPGDVWRGHWIFSHWNSLAFLQTLMWTPR